MIKMVQLTDDLIRDAFLKTGFDEKYFPVYEEKLKFAYNELQEEEPDDDETTEEENNVRRGIRITNDYISFYVEEFEKGHSERWAATFADTRCSEFNELYWVQEAYDSIDDNDQKEKDLDIHINSLSDDIIFRERYKSLFHDKDFFPQEKAAEYCEIYHRCIKAGKSALYAHAFANEVNNYIHSEDGYSELYVDIHAEAVEQAIEHGMDEDRAYCFGLCCAETYANGYWLPGFTDYFDYYREDWQLDFFLYLYRKYHKHDMPEDELYEIKRELSK